MSKIRVTTDLGNMIELNIKAGQIWFMPTKKEGHMLLIHEVKRKGTTRGWISFYLGVYLRGMAFKDNFLNFEYIGELE
jgi:hypothetical protein